MRKIWVVAALAMVAVLVFIGGAMPQVVNCNNVREEDKLSMIIWEGYADSSFADPFTQETGICLSVTFAGSSDEMFAGMIGDAGRAFDMVSASGDLTLRLIDAGLVAPINTADVPNYERLFDFFKGAPWNTVNGVSYGISFAWGPNVLVYRTDVISELPASWDILFDPQYAGRVSIPNNPITLADAALWLGFEDVYNLTEEQLEAAKQKMLELKPNLLTTWVYAADLAVLFQQEGLVMAHAWPLTTVQLRAAGLPVADTVPPEGSTGWSDSWMISSRSPHTREALAWIDYILTAQGQLGIINVTGYSGASRNVLPVLTAEQIAGLHMSEAEIAELHIRLRMWRTPPNYARWSQVWTEIFGL